LPLTSPADAGHIQTDIVGSKLDKTGTPPAKGEMDPLPPQRGHGVRPGLDRVLDRVVLVRRDPDGLPGEGDGVVTGRRVRCSNGTELKKTRSVFGAGARTLQVRLAMLHQERSGTAGTCDVQ